MAAGGFITDLECRSFSAGFAGQPVSDLVPVECIRLVALAGTSGVGIGFRASTLVFDNLHVHACRAASPAVQYVVAVLVRPAVPEYLLVQASAWAVCPGRYLWGAVVHDSIQCIPLWVLRHQCWQL